MRIGTWNLAGRWTSQHRELMTREACDVWLLTEVRLDVGVPGMRIYRTAELMGPRTAWAAILTGETAAVVHPDPHAASVALDLGDVRYVSSVLPWRSCSAPWVGSTLAEKMTQTLDAVRPYIHERTVWGGDWNQALEGREHVGSLDGRRQIAQLLDAARLSVPTRSLGSASPGQRSIDHIAVPMEWDVHRAHRASAQERGRELSDHHAYVISIDV